MKKDLTELVFILDKSGSMQGLEKDTIGGFNSAIIKQKELQGECYVTTVLFDNEYELLHDRIDVKAISNITTKEYYVGGTTALLDAIGKTIDKIVNVQRSKAEDYQAEKVIFVIITDGEENSSNEYSSKKVKKQIEYQTQNFNWEFIFLGANIDAVETAQTIGIKSNRAQNFHADEEGVALNFEVMSEAICSMRCSTLSENWNERLETDMKNRQSKR